MLFFISEKSWHNSWMSLLGKHIIGKIIEALGKKMKKYSVSAEKKSGVVPLNVLMKISTEDGFYWYIFQGIDTNSEKKTV